MDPMLQEGLADIARGATKTGPAQYAIQWSKNNPRMAAQTGALLGPTTQPSQGSGGGLLSPLPSKPKKYVGDKAVRMVSRMLRRPLTLAEGRVVMEEGYVDGTYRDTVRTPTHPIGVLTGGVGQTGKWIAKGFEAAFEEHVRRAKTRIPNLSNLPEGLQAELIQSEYRGSLGQSKDTVDYINEGKYREAAKEYLDNEEYKKPSTSKGIKRRMEALANSLKLYAAPTNDEEYGAHTP